MALPIPLLGGILDLGGKLIDRLIPDKEKQAEAKLALLTMQQAGELKELEVRMSAILAEAQSADPWTSRARPSFMYVMYVVILFSLPIGVLSVFSPEAATQIAAGFKAWLAAIPQEMWGLFGVGYVGYSVSRSYDKKQLIAGKE
jgi:hypothetical protein